MPLKLNYPLSHWTAERHDHQTTRRQVFELINMVMMRTVVSIAGKKNLSKPDCQLANLVSMTMVMMLEVVVATETILTVLISIIGILIFSPMSLGISPHNERPPYLLRDLCKA